MYNVILQENQKDRTGGTKELGKQHKLWIINKNSSKAGRLPLKQTSTRI